MEKLTRENIYQLVNKECDNWSKVEIKNISKIIRLAFDKLSGDYVSWSSGGGCEHLFFQLKDQRWIGFHNVNGDITITNKEYYTSEQLYEAFWEDFKNVTFIITKSTNTNKYGEFNNVKALANDIIEENFKSLI